MKTLTAAIVGIVLLFATGASFADTASAPAPPAAAQQPAITYPYTFHCKHCGMLITVKSPADWKKDCEMCACGEKNIKCSPIKIDPDAKPAPAPAAAPAAPAATTPAAAPAATATANAAPAATPTATAAADPAPAKVDAPKAAPAGDGSGITYPYSFHCAHCGMMITVHSAAEWKKDCEACACGEKNIECSPKKITKM